MTRISYADSALDGLYVGDVLLYLRQRGWQKKDHPNDKLLLLTGPKDDEGEPIVIGVPAKDDFADVKVRLAEVINALSVIENVSPLALIRSIQFVRSDVLNTKVKGLVTESNSVPLPMAAHLVQSLRSLITYAACVEENPTPHFTRATSLATKFANHCRFGQTFRGSFGFRIEVPIEPSIEAEQMDLFARESTDPGIPFDRRVVERIVRGLRNVHKSVHDEDVGVLVNNYREGFNANIFEVFLDLARNFEDIELECSASWSLQWRVADDIAQIQSVLLGSRTFQFMEAAAKKLRQVEESQETEIQGQIVQLKAEGVDAEDDLEDVVPGYEIVVRRDEPDKKAIRVQVTLQLEEYREACNAHRDGKKISIRGKLEKPGKKYILMSPSDFRVTD